MEASHSTETRASTKEIMVVSKVDLTMGNLETSPTEDSELTKERDSNVASMGSASIVESMDTRQPLVDLNV